MASLRITPIAIGNRHRKDIGDIAGLPRSIESVGLLHPVVVTPAGTLIAGERGLRVVASVTPGKTQTTPAIDADGSASVEAAPGGRVIQADKSPKAPSDQSAGRASQQGRL